MQSFLSHVINQVLSVYSTGLENVIFVLPNQRSCVFLKQELIDQLKVTTFLPKIISIEEFTQELAQIEKIDSVQLLFEFYSIYKSLPIRDKHDSFEVFVQWASIVLQDFNEVDMHLVDSKDLFAYLKDINRLDNWTPTTDLSKNYFKFFEHLDILYVKLYQYLLSKRIGYQGLIYREAEGNIHHYINANKHKHFVLTGFNALNKSEEFIFQELLQNGIASIFFDVDKSYLNKSNETGMFLRKYFENWHYFKNKEQNWVENFLGDEEKSIHFIGAPKNVSQLKYVGQLLEKKENLNNTALVLADEKLLSLTLNSLPSNIEKLNITMGYPLDEIPLASLFNCIFNLFLNQEKFGVMEKRLFYYKDVISLCSHSYFKRILGNDAALISQDIRKLNYIFLSKNQLSTLFAKINSESKDEFGFLFNDSGRTVKALLDNCLQICKRLQLHCSGIEIEYVFRFHTIFQQLETFNRKFGHIANVKTLHQIFLQLTKNEKLSFKGEPLEGLQLMGMLETRVIDFETVIITSVNEGILPKSKSDQSFIPFDVKKEFDLPTYSEKDAIFSYHFYRLMHRAKNIYFIYNTENDVFGSGEKSRFLTQLELKRKDIKKSILSAKIVIESPSLQMIEKTEDLILKLKELAIKGISPSALASYIYNPIDFYYQKILKIRETEEVEETVAANTMGTIIHEVLEHLYTPFINEYLVEDTIKIMRNQAPKLVEKTFKKEYKNGDITKGKNKLVFEVSKKLVDRFLQVELAEIKKGKQIKIITLEKKLSTQININGIEVPIKLHGIIDRIDQVDGVTRIIDYKTGMVTTTQLKMSDFSMMSDDYKYTKGLQVMLYAYLFQKCESHDLSIPLEAGIISLKNLKEGFMKMNFAEKRGGKDFDLTQSRMDEFLIELERLIREIFNPEIPFIESADRKY